jgi:uncharacterized protein DUF4258
VLLNTSVFDPWKTFEEMSPLDPDQLKTFHWLVQKSARRKLLFLSHAIRQMSRPDRMITASEVRRVIMQGEIIENYPSDSRGHSCLLWGRGDFGRNVHVVCSPKSDYLAVITAYLPDETEWEPNFKARRKP